MNTKMMELNMNEMEAVQGGTIKGAIVYGTLGALIGGTIGGVAGLAFGPIGAGVGAFIGAAGLGTMGVIEGYKDEEF